MVHMGDKHGILTGDCLAFNVGSDANCTNDFKFNKVDKKDCHHNHNLGTDPPF